MIRDGKKFKRNVRVIPYYGQLHLAAEVQIIINRRKCTRSEEKLFIGTSIPAVKKMNGQVCVIMHSFVKIGPRSIVDNPRSTPITRTAVSCARFAWALSSRSERLRQRLRVRHFADPAYVEICTYHRSTFSSQREPSDSNDFTSNDAERWSSWFACTSVPRGTGQTYFRYAAHRRQKQ